LQVFFLRRHIVAIFFALTYLISWSCWIGFGGLIALLGAFGPALAGLICAGVAGGRQGIESLLKRILAWRVSWKAYLFAISVPFLLAFFPLIFFGWMGGGSPRIENLVRVPQLLPMFLGSLFVGGLSEEPGWRGFALPQLRQRYGRVTASLLIGLFWGIWHVPLYTLGTPIPVPSLVGFILVTAIISILFTALADLAQDSVLLAMIFHAAYNTFILRLPGLLDVEPAAQHQMFAVLLVVAMVFIVLWWWRMMPHEDENGLT
jgi:membrane protease YdiL (CAAX protease family)